MVKLRQQQDGGIGGADDRVQAAGCDREDLRIPVRDRRLDGEHAAEEHDFGDQEDPHPEGGGVFLLLVGIELHAQRERFRRARDQPTSTSSPMTVL